MIDLSPALPETVAHSHQPRPARPRRNAGQHRRKDPDRLVDPPGPKLRRCRQPDLGRGALATPALEHEPAARLFGEACTIDRPRPVPLPTPLVEKNGSIAREKV